MPLDNKFLKNYNKTTEEGIASTEAKKIINAGAETFKGFFKEGAPPQFKPRDNEIEHFRVLPNYSPNAQHYACPKAIHYFKHVKASCVCPLAKYGECPSCAENKYIAFAEGGPKDIPGAQTYRSSASFAVYGLDMNNLSLGVHIWIITPTLKELIDSSIKDLSTGAVIEFDHPEHGQTLIFKKVETANKIDGKALWQVNKIQFAPPSPLPEEIAEKVLNFVYDHPIESWFIDTTPDEIREIAKLSHESRQKDRNSFNTMAAAVINERAAQKAENKATETPIKEAIKEAVKEAEKPQTSVPDSPPPPPENLKGSESSSTSRSEKNQNLLERMRAKKEMREAEKA